MVYFCHQLETGPESLGAVKLRKGTLLVNRLLVLINTADNRAVEGLGIGATYPGYPGTPRAGYPRVPRVPGYPGYLGHLSSCPGTRYPGTRGTPARIPSPKGPPRSR
eukprot:649945-Rhodomonas_salina.3